MNQKRLFEETQKMAEDIEHKQQEELKCEMQQLEENMQNMFAEK